MSVRLAPNGTVTEVKYYCLAGLIPPCGGPPDIDLSGFSSKQIGTCQLTKDMKSISAAYYACCGNADECNRYYHWYFCHWKLFYLLTQIDVWSQLHSQMKPNYRLKSVVTVITAYSTNNQHKQCHHHSSLQIHHHLKVAKSLRYDFQCLPILTLWHAWEHWS